MSIIRKCPKCKNEYPYRPYRKYCPVDHAILNPQEEYGGIIIDERRLLRK